MEAEDIDIMADSGGSGAGAAPGSPGVARAALSRRRFLGRGAIGVAAAGAMASVPGLGTLLAGGTLVSTEVPEVGGDSAGAAQSIGADTSGLAQSVVAHVSDVRNGIIDLHIDGATLSIRNPQLARTIAQAAR